MPDEGQKLFELTEGSDAYRDMNGESLPRGPIWDWLSAAGLGGMMAALGVEGVRFHNRIVDLMREAYPSTADELLAEWEEVYGLPLCDDLAPTDDLRRAALASRVAAQGGQSRAYFIGLARIVLNDPTAPVWVEENPDGTPFRVSENRVGDRLWAVGSVFYWILHLPNTATADQVDIIDCLVQRFKPAHTSAAVVADSVGYFYSSPGTAGSFLDASNNTAARKFFNGAGIESATLHCWFRQMSANGANLCTIGDDADDAIVTFAAGRFEQAIELYDAGGLDDSGAVAPPDDETWNAFALVSDGTEITPYLNGAAAAALTIGGTYATAQDVMILLSDALAEPAGIRNIAIFDRDLSADEVSDLYDAGPTHDVRFAAGSNWGGEDPPIYWCTQGDGNAVENSGDGGACSLVFNGAVTSEVD